MTALEEFDVWMQGHENNYINDFGVLINRVPELVFVDSPWPEHGDAATLGIILPCANALELYQLLGILIPQDFDNVQREDMLKLYYEGHAMAVCTTENGETLTFQKAKDDTLIAIIDGEDLAHVVQEKLLMPGDFIRYTEGYFRFLKTIAKEL